MIEDVNKITYWRQRALRTRGQKTKDLFKCVTMTYAGRCSTSRFNMICEGDDRLDAIQMYIWVKRKKKGQYVANGPREEYVRIAK